MDNLYSDNSIFTITEMMMDNKMVVPGWAIMYNQSYSLQTEIFGFENAV